MTERVAAVRSYLAGLQQRIVDACTAVDGKVVTVPCCDVIRIRGDKLCEQYAYLDQSAVWAETVEGDRRWQDAA